jgi:hypothetical protein
MNSGYGDTIADGQGRSRTASRTSIRSCFCNFPDRIRHALYTNFSLRAFVSAKLRYVLKSAWASGQRTSRARRSASAEIRSWSISRAFGSEPVPVFFAAAKFFDPAPDGKSIVALMPADMPEEPHDRVIFLMSFFDELRRRFRPRVALAAMDSGNFTQGYHRGSAVQRKKCRASSPSNIESATISPVTLKARRSGFRSDVYWPANWELRCAG